MASLYGGSGCSQIMGFLLIIFGLCTTTGTTGKDNMSRHFVIYSREYFLSLLEDHRLRVSVRLYVFDISIAIE